MARALLSLLFAALLLVASATAAKLPSNPNERRQALRQRCYERCMKKYGWKPVCVYSPSHPEPTSHMPTAKWVMPNKCTMGCQAKYAKYSEYFNLKVDKHTKVHVPRYCKKSVQVIYFDWSKPAEKDGRATCVAISRPASGARRRRRAKSPAAAGAVLAPPPRLLAQSGTLQLGRDATLQVELAEQELLQRAERMVNGGSGVAGQPTAAGVPAVVQPQSSVVAVPPELSKLLQRPAKQRGAVKEQPQESQQQQLDGKVPAEEQQPEAAAGQPTRRKQRQQRAAGGSDNGSSSGSSSPKKGQRRFIAPKSQGLLAWYDDTVVAAEQAYKQARRGRPDTAPSLGKALGKPIQGWMDERMEYMGFEQRSFPPLAPLGLPAHEAVAQQAAPAAAFDSGATRSCSSSGCGSMLSHVFAEWAQDEKGGGLPVLASQWHHVPGRVWDPRNAGLLLHECHAAHATYGHAQEHSQVMIQMYEEWARDVAGLPVVAGRRSARGTLRGAVATYTLEALVGDGRALQVASCHFLADNYSTVLGACFEGPDGEEQCIHQMGGGLQAAALSGVALVHGDDAGLRLPPELAPIQAVIVPMWFGSSKSKAALAEEAERVRRLLADAGVRAVVDGRRTRPGVRFGAADRCGAALRIEIGARDVASHTCTLVPRRASDATDPPTRLAGVSTEGGDALAAAVTDLLDDAQRELRWGAEAAVQEAVMDVGSFLELREVVEAGKWARGPWAGSPEDEQAILEETGASLRCIPLSQPTSLAYGFSTCLYSGYQATEAAIFARAL
ncbi:proline--tRNA chloroplastic mitochondrial [Chlorella sorokiniana]|uniref:proline--tRNA ligase n=1 Tax=Chlorella sorokiniana TaxID=3076 RepID=A0A2P6TXJ7_CHLSO|nr:proline--tRNA chloroplastic mitochondrial [Chlorella sorokiniana]|eukprot:PRW58782.1 proline--tRNA chloroplastic mitochondrial [Chlorella sorokiniana]